MNIDLIAKSIDAKVAARSSKDFGIKVSFELFQALRKSGHISVKKFGIMGTSLFEHDQHTYKGLVPVHIDFDMVDDEFTVGVPNS